MKEENQEMEEIEETVELDEELETVEQLEASEDIEENEEEEYIPEKTKSIRKLATLVAVTAIMLVSSTYAWFSSQKNVTIGNLEGEVNVAEGLMISLDAKNWSQEIDLVAPTLDTGRTLVTPYTGGSNLIPTEMLPVSATGVEDIGVNREITYYTGTNVNGIELYDVAEVGTGDKGYYAIDMFLQNSSKIDTDNGEEQGVTTETLQLNTNSLLQLLTTGAAELTGLQNTARVGLAMYNYAEGTDLTTGAADETASIFVTATQSQILEAYKNTTIKDIAIWEPNASDHVDYIVTNNNRITWGTNGYVKDLYIADSLSNGKFTATEMVPTYALTEDSLDASQTLTSTTSNGGTRTGIADIYNWAATDDYEVGPTSTGLQRQIALQTRKSEDDYTITDGGVRNLVSITSDGDVVYELGNEFVEGNEDGLLTFEMLKNSIIKLRLYVWLEGQDVDCTNYASHGGGVYLDLGLLKSAEAGSEGEAPAEGNTTTLGTYLPAGFSEVAAATTTTGLTIADGAGNQYVWVEVPQTLYENTSYNTKTTEADMKPESSTDYDKIEYCLQKYTATYRNGTSNTDTWYSADQHGFASADDYNAHKYKMLKSVFENGGFYVGKYETGIADSEPYVIDETVEARTASGATTGYTPVIQANAYPYNFVTCSQAQSLASGMSSGEYTSSLMFGVQWDLVLKYLETKGASTAELNSDSTSWGNYANNTTYNITNTSAKYAAETDSYAWVDGAYGQNASSSTYVVLSTGADSSFSKMGIYDLAGNVYEWTLEKTSISTYPCAVRGGSYNFNGSYYPASYRNSCGTTNAFRFVGFRVALY